MRKPGRSAVRSLVLGITLAMVAVLAIPASAVQTVVANDDPVGFTPHVRDGRVNAIARIGNTIYVGGTFTEVRNQNQSAWQTRNRLFALNATTGQIDATFNPDLNGAVEALAVAPDGNLFVGGRFTTIGPTTRRKLAKISPTTGAVIPQFMANASANVLDVDVAGGSLYVAGAFAKIKNTNTQGVARLNATTGAVDPNVNYTFTGGWKGTMQVLELDVTSDASKMVAVGNWQQVSGTFRPQIALFDLTPTSSQLASWQTSQFRQVDPNNGTNWCSATFASYMRDAVFSPDNSYFVVVTTGAYRANRMCDTASRWETNATGAEQMPSWVDWLGGDTLTAAAITETAIYVGGHQRWVNNPYRGDAAGPGAVARNGLAAFDPQNGLPYSFNPNRNPRGVGVFGFLVDDAGVWVGSDTDTVHGEFHAKLAMLPVAGGMSLPSEAPYELPGTLFTLEPGGSMVGRSFNGTPPGPPSTLVSGLGDVRGMFALNGRLYYGWDQNGGQLLTRTFNGTTLGNPTAVNLYGLDVQPSSSFLIPGTNTRVPSFTSQLQDITGMFYDHGRIYYTVGNDPRLYYRYFTQQSQVVGANLFVAATNTQVEWDEIQGMTLAEDNIYYSTESGGLFRIGFSNGHVAAGNPTQVDAGAAFESNGMFVFN